MANERFQLTQKWAGLNNHNSSSNNFPISNRKKREARALHEKVGNTERFSTWFERQLRFGFEEGTDFTSVKSFAVVNNGAKKEIQDYEVTIDMAK